MAINPYAVLQYIGARYVPKFYENPDTGDSTWKSGVAYEGFMVVTYQQNSYTSKIPVPATVGDPASNSAYWVKTCDFNASLLALQNRVNNIETQNGNEELNTTAQTLSGAVNELNIAKNNGQSISQFTKVIKNETSYITALSGDADFNVFQAVSYDTFRNRYCFVILKDNNECMLVSTASDMETVIERKVHTDLGHGNPFAYNPNTDRFVFAPSYSTKNVLVEVNAFTLETVAEHDFGGTSILLNDRYCGVTYDVEKNVYYVCTPNKICTINALFVEIARVECDFTGMIKNLPSSASYWSNLFTNGICYYKGKIFSIVTFNDGTYHHWIVATNLDGTPFATWKLSVDNGYNEVEALIVIDGGLHAFTRGTLFEDIVLTLQEYGDYSEFKWFECGVSIPDYADLDDYLVNGNYYTVTKANAQTVVHTAFVMSNYQLIVRQIVGYIEQIAISVISDRFVVRTRRYNATTHTWGSWVDLRHSTNTIYPTTRKSLNGVMTGHVTAGGTHCCVQLPSIEIYKDSNYTIAGGLTLEGKIIVRTIDGYYEHNSSHELDINNDLASYSVDSNGVGLYIDFVLPSAISHNNTPISVELSNAYLNYYNT